MANFTSYEFLSFTHCLIHLFFVMYSKNPNNIFHVQFLYFHLHILQQLQSWVCSIYIIDKGMSCTDLIPPQGSYFQYIIYLKNLPKLGHRYILFVPIYFLVYILLWMSLSLLVGSLYIFIFL